VPDGKAGAWRTLWADQDAERLAAALEDLASPSLFGGARVLVVRHAEGLREEEQEMLLARLPDVGAGGTLVLVAQAMDQRRKLFAACIKAGAAIGFPALGDVRLVQEWGARLARERGHEITPGALQELVDRTGLDLGVLAGEVEKLSLHAGAGRRIEPSHVRAVTTAARTHTIQELTDRLARGDRPAALRLLRSLLAEGEPPIRAAAFLAANLRRALHIAELAERGLDGDAIAAKLGMPSWLVRRSQGRGSAAALTRALLALRQLDLELKTSRPAEAVFEAALLEIAD
jgi:DNA polymerase-3 subunit delta